MKLGLKALVIALVVGLAAVPAAFAKNGGNGHGKPSWAGVGKPSWAGSGHAAGKAQHEKKAKEKKPKHHGADSAADEGTSSDGGADLDGLNPAWYCKTLSDEMTKLERDFAAMFGTNPNNANAFGKCVSRRAHGEDLSDAAGGDEEQPSCDTTEPPATDGTDTGAEGSGTETTASDDEAASDDEETSDDEANGDEGSDDAATDPEECESDDSASDEPADELDQGDDEQGEDEQGEDEDNASGEGDSSDLSTALRFLRL
jgi:hypothetical protein